MVGIEIFKASMCGLNQFKSRHSIIGTVMFDEAAFADKDCTAAGMSASLGSLLDYAQSDIYNANGTGLFYEMLQQKTLDFKGQRCQRGKHSKKRTTVLLCANTGSSISDPR